MEINKAEAIVELQKLKEQVGVLEAVINATDKPTAKEWLENFMKQEFRVKFADGYITYYIGDQWAFQLNLIREKMNVYYYKVWQYLIDEYTMEYDDIQSLIKDVVGTTLNCNEFTPICNRTYYEDKKDPIN